MCIIAYYRWNYSMMVRSIGVHGNEQSIRISIAEQQGPNDYASWQCWSRRFIKTVDQKAIGSFRRWVATQTTGGESETSAQLQATASVFNIYYSNRYQLVLPFYLRISSVHLCLHTFPFIFWFRNIHCSRYNLYLCSCFHHQLRFNTFLYVSMF